MSRIQTSLLVVGIIGGAGSAFAQPGDLEAPPAAPAPPVEEAKPAPVAPASDPEPAPGTPPVVVAPTPSDAAAASPEAETPVTMTGGALEIRLESSQTFIDDDFALPTTQAGVFLGHRGEAVTIGVGLELGRLSQSRTESDGMGGTFDPGQASTTVMVLPGVRFTMARSADRRTELLGQIDVGYGATFFSNDSGGTDPNSIHRLRLQGGPAIRHWISPSFAVGATAGLRYERLSRSSDTGGVGPSSEMALATTGMFGSLQLTSVF